MDYCRGYNTPYASDATLHQLATTVHQSLHKEVANENEQLHFDTISNSSPEQSLLNDYFRSNFKKIDRADEYAAFLKPSGRLRGGDRNAIALY